MKDLITAKLAKGETVSFAECKRMVRDILESSEAQAREDFELLESPVSYTHLRAHET